MIPSDAASPDVGGEAANSVGEIAFERNRDKNAVSLAVLD